jgi:hypothetical protein
VTKSGESVIARINYPEKAAQVRPLTWMGEAGRHDSEACT